jgi:hypothetical protein
LDKQQKISLIALGTFTILVMVFGVLQFRHNLYSPFDYSKKVATVANTINGTTTDLTKLDSDSDGLNDFDEINVYQTSPYLEDSDSDGFNDKEEILNNTDPNCPAGTVCTQITTESSGGTTTASSLEALDDTLSAEDQAAQDMLSGKSDPAVLRKLLLDNGMDKASLDKISDADLLASYQESLKNQAAAQAE